MVLFKVMNHQAETSMARDVPVLGAYVCGPTPHIAPQSEPQISDPCVHLRSIGFEHGTRLLCYNAMKQGRNPLVELTGHAQF